MTVYVVQNQMRYDRNQGKLVPKFDLNPALEFGNLHYLLSPTAKPFEPAPIIRELHEKLSTYSDDDYLLLIGNPMVMSWAVAVAAEYNEGYVTTLQWSGRDNRYLPVSAQLYPLDTHASAE